MLGLSLAAGAGKAAHPRSAKPAGTDYVRELINNYHDGSERMRFFAAAGVDIELSKAEFAAAMGKSGSFVRRYDRWQAAIVFDENSNGTLDWFEAEAYRLSLRQQVMSLFDKNKNRKVDGVEAAAANRWLARGVKPIARRQAVVIVRGPAVKASADVDSREPAVAVKGGEQELSPGFAWQQTWREMEREFDKDGDGGLSYEERKELYKAYRERSRQRMLEQWDSDRDGRLSERERERMAGELRKVAQQRQEAFAKMRKEPISPTELARRKRAAMQREANQKIFAEARERAAAEHEEHMRRWDTDGDGKISDDERSRLNESRQRGVSEVERIKNEGRMAAFRERSDQQRKKRLNKWDTDGDGKLSVQEQRALYEEVMRIEAKLRSQPDGNKAYRGDTEGDTKTKVETKKPAPAAKAEKLPAMLASAPQGTPELPAAAEDRDKGPIGRREEPEQSPRAGSRRRQSIAAWGGGERGSSPHFVAAVAAGIGACAALVATVLLFTGQHHFRSAFSRLLRRMLGRR
jgi:Ca2+-binding EF-hand superfamily protein